MGEQKLNDFLVEAKIGEKQDNHIQSITSAVRIFESNRIVNLLFDSI